MGRIAVLGEAVRVAPFALAGATIAIAEDAAAVRTVWMNLPTDIAVVVVTSAAAVALTDDMKAQRTDVLTVTLP